ncbi:Tumor susceptibility protein [Fasciola gigantica]|uniref:Tumor susceptibility protein n=1 Tax=Fasciola gigantica TaxID=46835 RepID=A0A504YDK5_FASGI|nr:Tumor susceptibility protein [Fasciola gigantica]
MTKQRNDELSDLLDRLTTTEKQPINVDEAVDTTFPLYKQLVSSFAEEQAIEDAVYYLGDALGKGALDLDSFLKKVRELSRKQFILRATVQQCREKAGLPAS